MEIPSYSAKGMSLLLPISSCDIVGAMTAKWINSNPLIGEGFGHRQLEGVSWILCKRNSLMLRHPIAELNSKTIKRSFPVSYWQRPFPADILLC